MRRLVALPPPWPPRWGRRADRAAGRGRARAVRSRRRRRSRRGRCGSRRTTPRSTGAPRASWSRTCPRRATRRPARSPRSSSGPGPTCCWSTSSTSTPGGVALRPVPAQLPVGVAQRLDPDLVPVRVHRAVQHRRPVRPRPQQRRHRRRRRTTRTASASSPASSGWRSTRASRSTTRDPHLPALPLGGHAGRADPAGLVHPGGAGRGPAVQQVALGRADRDRRKTVHFLVSHPTPPVFDGPEDRNGRRNHDEIRLWADYISPGRAGYLYDDAGRRGGLKPGSLFVIAGDQNSDPNDGDSIPGAAQQLLDNPLVNTRLRRPARVRSSRRCCRAGST